MGEYTHTINTYPISSPNLLSLEKRQTVNLSQQTFPRGGGHNVSHHSNNFARSDYIPRARIANVSYKDGSVD